jgi:hypothetical protein
MILSEIWREQNLPAQKERNRRQTMNKHKILLMEKRRPIV